MVAITAALEDCNTAVAKNPVAAPLNGLRVTRRKEVRMASPAVAFSPSVMRDMPNKNIPKPPMTRSEEHTSELQSRGHLVCRLLLEKKKNAECSTKSTHQ